MQKEEFIKLIDSLNLPKNKYYICSGGALLMMGIREQTSDLDMCITPSLLEELKKNYDVKKSEKKFDNLFYINNLIDSNTKSHTEKFDHLFYINDLIEFFINPNGEEIVATFIDGYPCEPLASVLAFKEKHRRPKDLIDIENIKIYLKRTS